MGFHWYLCGRDGVSSNFFTLTNGFSFVTSIFHLDKAFLRCSVIISIFRISTAVGSLFPNRFLHADFTDLAFGFSIGNSIGIIVEERDIFGFKSMAVIQAQVNSLLLQQTTKKHQEFILSGDKLVHLYDISWSLTYSCSCMTLIYK